jgi:hypothetical protein
MVARTRSGSSSDTILAPARRQSDPSLAQVGRRVRRPPRGHGRPQIPPPCGYRKDTACARHVWPRMSSRARSIVRTPKRSATRALASRALARPCAEGVLASFVAPRAGSSPANSQAEVPFSNDMAGLGKPEFSKAWAPMMARVRPAQLTTIRVVGTAPHRIRDKTVPRLGPRCRQEY